MSRLKCSAAPNLDVKLRAISGNSHAHHSCVEKREKLSGPVFPTIYDFGSIQISDTLMSDG